MAAQVAILLIEDNDEDAELMQRALKKHNLTGNLVRLGDGAAALDWFFSDPSKPMPQVVLLDLKLPKVDGMAVLKELKARDVTKTVPVVMLTSSKEERDLREAYRLGANSYIVKPVEFDQFISAVEQLGRYWVLLNQR
ncbi:MAG: response regulator [Myxococcaceae bacterium]|nr:response regulator [Myxococcaceae bacterium]